MTVSKLNSLALSTLLRVIATNRNVAIHSFDGDYLSDAVIHGGDLITGQLLIERHDANAVDQEDVGSKWLVIRENHQQLRVHLKHQAITGGLITFDIIDYCWTDNRRWHNRLYSPPHQGSSVTLLVGYERFTGKVRDISRGGLAIDFWSKELTKGFRQADSVNVDIAFNDIFQLQCNASITSARFFRKPSCYTQLRLEFKNMTHLHRSQLTNFIESAILCKAAYAS